MKTALKIKRNVTENVEKIILSNNPGLQSVQNLPDSLKTKMDDVIFEHSSLLLDIQQEIMNPSNKEA